MASRKAVAVMAARRISTLVNRVIGEVVTIVGRAAARAMQQAAPGLLRTSEYDIRTAPAREGHVSLPGARWRKPVSTRYDPKLEVGVRELRKGKSLKAAARSAHVASERLRSYMDQVGRVERVKGRLVIRDDMRTRSVPIFSQGREVEVVLPGYDEARLAGEYMSAVGHFLRTNDVSYLVPFRGKSVQDLNGKRHLLETRPNVLYRLNLDSTESYEQIYRIVA
jgi:hypothetical protein